MARAAVLLAAVLLGLITHRANGLANLLPKDTAVGTGGASTAPIDGILRRAGGSLPKFTYRPVNALVGVNALKQTTADFAFSPTPVTPPDKTIVNIPFAIGSISFFTGVLLPQKIRLDGNVLGKIATGAIRNWNHPALTSQVPTTGFPGVNANLKTKTAAIRPVFRGDAGSAATFIATQYWYRQARGSWPTGARDTVSWARHVVRANGQSQLISLYNAQPAVSLTYVQSGLIAAGEVFLRAQGNANSFIVPSVSNTNALGRLSFPSAYNAVNVVTTNLGVGVYPAHYFAYFLASTKGPNKAALIALANFVVSPAAQNALNSAASRLQGFRGAPVAVLARAKTFVALIK